MEVTHHHKNVKNLESKLGFDSVEMFIEAFSVELELIDDMAEMKPWDDVEVSAIDQARFDLAKIPMKELKKNNRSIDKELKKQIA